MTKVNNEYNRMNALNAEKFKLKREEDRLQQAYKAQLKRQQQFSHYCQDLQKLKDDKRHKFNEYVRINIFVGS